MFSWCSVVQLLVTLHTHWPPSALCFAGSPRDSGTAFKAEPKFAERSGHRLECLVNHSRNMETLMDSEY